MKIKLRWSVVIWILVMVFLITACGKDSSAGAEYKGVKYDGEGTTETMVSMAILNEDEVLFLQQVKIIDDYPTVWKALEAISANQEQQITIEKDLNGHISKINGKENNDKSKWVLLIDNAPDDGNVEEIELGDDQNLTLTYE